MDNNDSEQHDWLDGTWIYLMSNDLIPPWMSLSRFKEDWYNYAAEKRNLKEES